MLESFVNAICSSIRESIETEIPVSNFFELRDLEMSVNFQLNAILSGERPETEKAERVQGKRFNTTISIYSAELANSLTSRFEYLLNSSVKSSQERSMASRVFFDGFRRVNNLVNLSCKPKEKYSNDFRAIISCWEISRLKFQFGQCLWFLIFIETLWRRLHGQLG